MAAPFIEAAEATTVTVRVPMSFRRRGGRKLMIAGDGDVAPARKPLASAQPITPVVKALARAFRWRRLLETGAYATVQDLAKAERINSSYVSRVLRLTLLAPEIVEAILDGQLQLSLSELMRPFAVYWWRQTVPLLGAFGWHISQLGDVAFR